MPSTGRLDMPSSCLTRRFLTLVVAVCAAFGSAAIAGCGNEENAASGAKSGSGEAAPAAGSGVDEAKKLIAPVQEEVEWQAPGPEFDATKAAGKSVWYIAPPLAIPFVKTLTDGFVDAVEEAGAKVTMFDGKGGLADQARGFEQAIAQNADLIVFQGIRPAAISAQIQSATKAGIPIISAVNADPGSRLKGENDNVLEGIAHCVSCAGKMMADFVIADSGGKANAVAIWASDFYEGGQMQLDGIKGEFERLCPDCKLKIVDEPSAQWAQLTTLTQSLLRQDPTIDYLLPLYDGMATFMFPGIEAAGAGDTVKLVSFNATPAVMKDLSEGGVVVAEVGSAADWQGWAVADSALRELSGVDAIKDPKVPMRLFTKDNIGSIDLSAQESTWYGSSDYKSEYKTLWGLG